MKLIKIDKARYRKHLNRVIIGCIAIFAVIALGLAQILIQIFPDPSGSHFHWNLSGVIVGAVFTGWLLNKYRGHDFMTEVTYVWELKQSLNKINRKIMKIKAEAEKGNVDALLALQYSYAGSRWLWELDDNTIVMDELAIEQIKLDKLLEHYNIELDTNNYDEASLKQF